MAGVSQKEVKVLLKAAADQGCEVVPRKNGATLRCPDGTTTICLHLTTSDHRVMANMRAAWRRAGLAWPFDNRRAVAAS